MRLGFVCALLSSVAIGAENVSLSQPADDPILLLAHDGRISQMDLETGTVKFLADTRSEAGGMDFHVYNQTLVYSDIGWETLFMCEMRQAARHNRLTAKCGDEMVRTNGMDSVFGLAIDWIHNLLYWTHLNLRTISVMDLQTRRTRRSLFTFEIAVPRAVVVEPRKGVIFWSSSGLNAKIERAGMDGQSRLVIHAGATIIWPIGLALDLQDERLFWVDGKGSIYSSDYDGGSINSVYHSQYFLTRPFSLTVFEDRVFYTDWTLEAVNSINKFTGSELTRVLSNVSYTNDVRIYQRAVQPDFPNICANHACGEDSICLPRDVDRIEGGSDIGLTPYSCIAHDGPIDVPSAYEYFAATTKKSSPTSSSTTTRTPSFSTTVQPDVVLLQNKANSDSVMQRMSLHWKAAILIASVFIVFLVFCPFVIYRRTEMSNNLNNPNQGSYESQMKLLKTEKNVLETRI